MKQSLAPQRPIVLSNTITRQAVTVSWDQLRYQAHFRDMLSPQAVVELCWSHNWSLRSQWLFHVSSTVDDRNRRRGQFARRRKEGETKTAAEKHSTPSPADDNCTWWTRFKDDRDKTATRLGHRGKVRIRHEVWHGNAVWLRHTVQIGRHTNMA